MVSLYEFLCLCIGFIDFGKQYERNIYSKGHCDLSIATCRLCDELEEVCVRSCTRSRVVRVDCELPNYNFVITRGQVGKIKDQCLRLYKASEISFLDLTKLIGTLSSTIQVVLPSRLQFSFLQQQQILSLKQTQTYLTLVKLTPMEKNKLLWWVENLELCNGQLVIQPQLHVLIQTD